jgi:hypothetical protein
MVSAGVHSFFKMSRQIAPVCELILGCHILVSNFICISQKLVKSIDPLSCAKPTKKRQSNFELVSEIDQRLAKGKSGFLLGDSYLPWEA